MSKGKILFQLSGSIACFKACQLLSKLAQNGYEIEVVATASALKFVGEATLEGLTGRRVHREAFEPGQYMKHIHLARWADLILLCPASANVINKFAAGIADDLVTTLFLANDFKKPFWIAPAMNVEMLRHPATQSSLEKLESWGVRLLGTGSGALACGEVGEGRLIEPEILFGMIEKHFGGRGEVSRAEDSLKILITSGGTRVPIDGVRSIANFSTGSTGATLSDALTARGHSVTLLRARDALAPRAPVREKEFVTFQDLETMLKTELSERDYDVVIHAAAVSDYSVASLSSNGKDFSTSIGKVDSGEELTLKLHRNPKLIDQLRSFSRNKAIRVVGFKLTNSLGEAEQLEAVRKLASHARADLLVHNDLGEIVGARHRARIYSSHDPKNLVLIAEVEDKASLAKSLESLLVSKGRA